ncbi:MAG: transketolase C-terminal domain-containing protein [Candidatus Omnitrophota bacterium]
MEMCSRVHAHHLVEWAKDKSRIVVFSADLTSSTEVDLFKEAYPKRFFSFGIAEQNMMSFAGGMSREGFVPFVHTFGVFIYRRAYDQIAMSIAYPNLPVKMFGFLPGIMTPGGATHQAIEDISVMRSLPNMTILECADATEVESVLDVVYAIDGPVYVRMARGEIPRLFSRREPFVLGQARYLAHGRDIVILSSGICTFEAIKAVKALEQKGVSVEHLHISTFKPFDDARVLASLSLSRYGVITFENHSVVGGLGSLVSEMMTQAGIGGKLLKIGIPDVFLHGASRTYLAGEYGLDAAALIAGAEKMMNKKFDIKEAELGDMQVPLSSILAKPEAL